MVTVAASRTAIAAIAGKDGEMAFATAQKQLYVCVEGAATADGVSILASPLADTYWHAVTQPLPALAGQGGKGVRVNAGATALEYYTLA